MIAPDKVLGFWFATAPGKPDYGKLRHAWFEKSDTFDREVRTRLGAAHEVAVQGLLNDWVTSARGALALVILLDQVPRNIFRDTPRAYESDGKAREIASAAIARGLDRNLLPVERMFLYLPFEHSERIEDQERALELFATLEAFPETKDIMKTVRRHYEIVARFGRFPHRNAVLGRATTPEEATFLQGPDSSF